MSGGVNITLKEIIQRKIAYCQSDHNPELAAMNAGYVRGFTQMLSDLEADEPAFISKYTGIIRSLNSLFERPEAVPEGDIDELSGYNNAIVDVLSLLDERYLYSENW